MVLKRNLRTRFQLRHELGTCLIIPKYLNIVISILPLGVSTEYGGRSIDLAKICTSQVVSVNKPSYGDYS